MKKLFFLTSLFLVTLFFLKTDVLAQKKSPSLKVPEKALEIGPGIYDLGEAIDVDGKKVEGIMVVKKVNSQNTRGGGAQTKPNQCYSYLANETKWKTKEDYIVNPSNSVSLDEIFVRQTISGAIGKWESASHYDISGDEVSGLVDGADNSSPDGKNEVLFGTISDPNVIAVTIVWGIFSGPPSGRYLSEWDQVYNQSNYSWSSNGQLDKMDLENIATHEIGHALGMGHPSDVCKDETMYRYSSNGETKKRDLNFGDILGIDKLY